jgi:hypothetical protein
MMMMMMMMMMDTDWHATMAFYPSIITTERLRRDTQWVGLGLIPDSDLTRRPGINQISGWRQACA